MIKRYIQFIKENRSIGELVEELYDDDYIKNIVNRYIGEITPDIELSNAINLLDDKVKNDISQQIEEYKLNGIQNKDVQVTTSTETELLESSEITSAGKGVFTSFLKSLTALGQKEAIVDREICPENYLFYYSYNLLADDVKVIFSRFKSLLKYIDLIDYSKNNVTLYFGINCKGDLEYGLLYETYTPIGRFKMSNSAIKYITSSDLKSATSLKKDIVNLNYNDILLFGKIKNEFKEFNPGHYEKVLRPFINDRVITFGYYGIGKWENGKMDSGELITLRGNFNNWVLNKKWGEKILVALTPNSFWLYIKIKLK